MSDEFKAWLREICERHRDALEEIGWVDVVRCEECKFRLGSYCHKEAHEIYIYSDDFCSKGEKEK